MNGGPTSPPFVFPASFEPLSTAAPRNKEPGNEKGPSRLAASGPFVCGVVSVYARWYTFSNVIVRPERPSICVRTTKVWPRF